MADQRFEMLWDCSYCGSKKLLAFTHKFCPSCGGAQDAANRYFPQEGEEVAVKDHPYAGADKMCPACKAPNGAKSVHCGQCGAGLDGAKEAVRHQDDGKTADDRRREKHAASNAAHVPPPVTAKKKKSYTGLKIGIGVAILALLFVSLYRKDAGIEIKSHSWQRDVALQTLTEVKEQADCSGVPSTGRVYDRFQDKRSRKVEDGQSCKQECSTARVDRGDGTFSKDKTCRDVCTTKYRTEHYTVAVCKYAIDKWVPGRKLQLEGKNLQPAWPDVKLAAGAGPRSLGQEREEGRAGKYFVHFVKDGEADKALTCDVEDEALWKKLDDGGKVVIPFMITGDPDCDGFAKLK